MAFTSRKKRPLDHAIPHLRDTRLIIIATEGSETEKQYFEIFRDTRVQVKVLPTERGESSPRHVFHRLDKYKREYDLGADDQLWVMIDVDRWPQATLAQVAGGAQKKGFFMAVSNPCFELWLHLHHAEIEVASVFTPEGMKKKLSEVLGGYDHTNVQIEKFRPHIDDAVRRAKDLDTDSNARWPNRTGTHVYRVVEKIRDLMSTQPQ